MINLKKIICWPPLLAGVGAAVTIGILAYMTYQTELGLWLLASFGATTVIVFGYHDNSFAQPKNVFFGHLSVLNFFKKFKKGKRGNPITLKKSPFMFSIMFGPSFSI